VAVAFGLANVFIVDELLDLEDVYWSAEGRKSVDAAIGVIDAGATFFACPSGPMPVGHCRLCARSEVGSPRRGCTDRAEVFGNRCEQRSAHTESIVCGSSRR
jgi:hypothetical protein